jgi:hypothetical protein
MTTSGERARWLRAALLVLLGLTAIGSFMTAISVQSDETMFNDHQRQFEYGGTPVVGTVVTKTSGRRSDYFLFQPQPLFGAERAGPESSGLKQLRVSSSTYRRYQPGDRIELSVIGEEAVVRGEKFEPVLTENQAWVLFAVVIGAIVFVKFGWRIEEPGNPLA